MFAEKNSLTLFLICVVLVFGTTACLSNASKSNGLLVDIVDNRVLRPEIPVFREVSIHDPVVIKVDNTYYAFGSHLAAAKSQDLIKWSQLSTNVSNYNRVFPNAKIELAEELSWAGTNTTWAKGIIELNGLYNLYYCVSSWGSPRSAIGLATAEDIEGPYKNQGMFLNSGLQGNKPGEFYNRSLHPNAIDPDVFFDKEDRLWMVYGSYFGGMYILELDPKTGYPYPEQGYGKHLAGGSHAPMEGPHIQYNSETDYYYLFISYGTLSVDGGYNIRVFRSENPDGPYLDPTGLDAKYAVRSSANAMSYGAKLMGNFLLTESNLGYISPGHNSTLYDLELGKNFIFFHTRFPGRGEMHNLRVHQMLMNTEGWPVVAPHRYAGETVGIYRTEDVVGVYQYINHGKAITSKIVQSSNIKLSSDGKISGTANGEWKLTGDYTVTINIDGDTYYGVFLEQWDAGLREFVMTFSALSKNGIAIWGSQIVD